MRSGQEPGQEDATRNNSEHDFYSPLITLLILINRRVSNGDSYEGELFEQFSLPLRGVGVRGYLPEEAVFTVRWDVSFPPPQLGLVSFF